MEERKKVVKREKMARPETLTEELTLKIRVMVLDGVKYKEIQEKLEIPAGTWDYWVYKDYQGFREALNKWKEEVNRKRRERMLDVAEDNLENIARNGENEKNKLDASKFISKTLGKEFYSERTEHTGENGQPLSVNIINYGDTNSPQVPTKGVPNTNTESDGERKEEDNPSVAS